MRYIQFAIVLFMVTSCKSSFPEGLSKKTINKDKELLDHSKEKPEKQPVIDLTNLAIGKEDLKAISRNSTEKNIHDSKATNINSNQTGTSKVHGLPKINETLEEKTTEIESGAITRGILVFVGIGFFFILYVGIKTCRRKKQDKSRTIIRKYGVRTKRTDLEMEPLPLSDDDEDETVFDLTATRNSNH